MSNRTEKKDNVCDAQGVHVVAKPIGPVCNLNCVSAVYFNPRPMKVFSGNWSRKKGKINERGKNNEERLVVAECAADHHHRPRDSHAANLCHGCEGGRGKAGRRVALHDHPVIWLPSISGSMKLEPPPGFGSGKVNTGPDDYLEDLDFVGMLDLQVQKGRWTLLADIIYADFSGNDTAQFPGGPGSGGGTVEADWDLQALLLEFAGAYSVFRNEYLNFDLLAGVRYAGIDGKVDLDIIGPPPAFVSSQTFSKTESFVDPIVVSRASLSWARSGISPIISTSVALASTPT